MLKLSLTLEAASEVLSRICKGMGLGALATKSADSFGIRMISCVSSTDVGKMHENVNPLQLTRRAWAII
jgi:hypothetical protein